MTEILERRNVFSRTFGPVTKRIAANLDLVLIVAATEPLFNTTFIDRSLITAYHEDIPVVLILNKIDVQLEETLPLLEPYEQMDLEILQMSAEQEVGVEDLRQKLADERLKVVALAGVSGVGKSTILNLLVPEAERKTRQVSRKTGQGRQTTSQAVAYRYERKGLPDLLLIDVPGVQQFGVTHLNEQEVRAGMPDLREISAECEYTDCTHTAEPNCAVKDSVESGELAASRYISYLGMLEDLEKVREY